MRKRGNSEICRLTRKFCLIPRSYISCPAGNLILLGLQSFACDSKSVSASMPASGGGREEVKNQNEIRQQMLSEQAMREKYARDFLGLTSRDAVPGIGKI